MESLSKENIKSLGFETNQIRGQESNQTLHGVFLTVGNAYMTVAKVNTQLSTNVSSLKLFQTVLPAAEKLEVLLFT